MKRGLLYTCLLVTFWACALPSQASGDPVETVERYTQALAAGDVNALKAVLGGRLYAKRRVLLEENAEYPALLRRHYAGASFSSARSSRSSDRYPDATLVNIEMLMASGERLTTTLVLEQSADGSGWKIIDETR
jgi:hypothetical protein